jgi:hypothetical protein
MSTASVPVWESLLNGLLPGILTFIEGLFPNTGAKTGTTKLAAATTISKSVLSVAHKAGVVTSSEASDTSAIQSVINSTVAAQKAKGAL